jgi:hypothetical protein
MQRHYRKTYNLCYLNFYNFQGFEVIKSLNRGLPILLIFMRAPTRIQFCDVHVLIDIVGLYYLSVKKNRIYGPGLPMFQYECTNAHCLPNTSTALYGFIIRKEFYFRIFHLDYERFYCNIYDR